MDIFEGDFIAIMGPSGAGKTTLLNLLSTLDKPTKGEILLEGKDITKLSNKQLSLIRRDKIGFIFQEYNLLDNMTLQDNIALPLSLNGAKSGEIIRKVQQRACAFGLESHLRKYPYQLSGGQKQRAASARADRNPGLFADEPTEPWIPNPAGFAVPEGANEEEKATILMVTHDGYTASYARQVYFLKDGKNSQPLKPRGKQKGVLRRNHVHAGCHGR
ncbi:MAG: ABC transporter ATP-binding protein [Blautia faecis]